MKLLKKPSPIWLNIISELFINLAAGWFAIVILNPNLKFNTGNDIFALTINLLLGILSLLVAKYLREEAEKWK